MGKLLIQEGATAMGSGKEYRVNGLEPKLFAEPACTRVGHLAAGASTSHALWAAQLQHVAKVFQGL